MGRDYIKVAQLIAKGMARYSAHARCGNTECSKLLLEPAAFNAESRFGLGKICADCAALEVVARCAPSSVGRV